MNESESDNGTLEQEQIAQKASYVADASKRAPKGGLIQFRVEEQLMSRLKSLAEMSGTSPGMLCRQWALEKINEHETHHLKRALSWHKERLKAIQDDIQLNIPYYADKPYFVLHAVPLGDNKTIAPERAQAIAGTLHPLRRTRAFNGRFNHLGYQSSTTEDSTIKAHLQVFRSGEIETLRPIWLNQIKGVINGTFTDAEIVDAASTACATLAGLQVPLPYALLITVCGVKDLTMSHGYAEIQVDTLQLPAIEVKEWEQIAKDGSIEAMAQTLHDALNVLWNAGGVSTSATFKGDEWLLAKNPGF